MEKSYKLNSPRKTPKIFLKIDIPSKSFLINMKITSLIRPTAVVETSKTMSKNTMTMNLDDINTIIFYNPLDSLKPSFFLYS